MATGYHHDHSHCQGHGHGHGHPEAPIEGKLVRVFSKANPEFYLTGLEDGSVLMRPANVSDPHQIWIKDDSWGARLQDAAGSPAFALINRATGKALSHGNSENEQVVLAPIDRNSVEDDVLWTTSDDLGHGFRTLRLYNNVNLNLDADHGDKKHGGIKDGTRLILFHWVKDHENQFWKIVPV
ncbi:hypothetical protein O6H91_18G005300 [Diphasiastrum complanatum]|uniref:Uncharacterized protein n=2 Tax=Diphasiastrum complanatum TaxID=34168 RepID=A0ACC2AXN5_DIPCM|nr:hypothetical protein O6H91_18G005100 [Diphasiastrum complanatum]KAJ7522295.1 hypothetical protein O6H91_18G005300 [Diphasiastrum complanatum]